MRPLHLLKKVVLGVVGAILGVYLVFAIGTIVQRSALLGSSPLTHRVRFLLEMPTANLFDFLL